MTQEERIQLEAEWKEINLRLQAEFPSPKDQRRKEEITALLMTDGASSKIKFKFLKLRKDSTRVTSFTRDRR